jgi:hypothetical protein
MRLNVQRRLASDIGRATDNWLRATLEHQETGTEQARATMVEAERRLAAFEQWLLSQIRNSAKVHRQTGGNE